MIGLKANKSVRREIIQKSDDLLCGRIAVTGTGRCTGATTIALMAAGKAAEAGEAVSFTECHEPALMTRLVYHILSIDRRKGTPASIYRAALEGRPLKDIKNRMEMYPGHIDWRIVMPNDVEERILPDKAQMMRICASAAGDVCVFDISSDGRMDHLLADMDLVVAVADPLPSRLFMQGARIASLKYLKSKGVRVIFVVNCMNDGVSRREIKRMLRDPDVVFFNRIADELIYGAEFGAVFPWEQPATSEAASELFTKLSRCNHKVIER